MDRTIIDDERAVARWLGVTLRRLRASARIALGHAPRVYGFRDRVAVQTVESLRAAGVDRRRIARAMRAVRARASASGVPLASMRLRAVGRRVVVEHGDRRSLPDGQGLLAFDPAPTPCLVRPMPHALDAALAARAARAHERLATLLDQRGDAEAARLERARADALSARSRR